MTTRHFQIDWDTYEAAKAHIQQQFDTHSWWPTEEPEKAKQEYRIMNTNPAQLAYWCEKWLNGAQWRQLEIEVRKRLRSG
ncbi:hypothetical protein [Methylocaldum szegediense]|uniref:Uncharacterized protein n=1 Tax=Methylocaldum szegediense TaxID=73780 RepID=A0ABN8X105_9GAMM|nr:hypothetical protein [Methylocaldum szegediense]CAI8764015.1 conserved protein of unknown function [Methylocaldum szegediense]